MTNKEKYAEQILDIACGGYYIALDKKTMKPVSCNDIQCEDCYFEVDIDKKCGDACKEWCESEYKESPIDWSKIPVDTPILVKDLEDGKWVNRHFARFTDNCIYAWSDGKTSWSASGNNINDVTPWRYAKLTGDEV